MLDTGAVQTPVAVPVQGFCENRSDAKRKKVFNLTVEDCHLFYANGFLVHNCDATTQALRYLSAGHRLNINPAIPRQLQGLRFRR
jgi:putative SOS response-associated peptidase YedK